MASGRRLAVLVVALALVGAPAVALRAFCVGNSCAQDANAPAPVPFCPLPADLRAQIEAGYREGRSPDVMGAMASGVVLTGRDGVPWPQAPFDPRTNRVPIAFFGHGVKSGRMADGIGVDRIAPTLARLMGFDRSHPEVRSGTAIRSAVQAGAAPPLLVEIVWTGVGADSADTSGAGAPWMAAHLRDAAWTYNGTTGALPVDPAAVLTTIGTGGLPSEHGITGSLVRDAHGVAVPAWSAAAPTSIIATLPDDWDRSTAHRARIGLVAPDLSDRGLVGGTWYIDHGRDDLEIGPGDPVQAVKRLLDSGYGSDATADVLGVVLHGPAQRMDRQTGAIVAEVQRQVPSATFVVTATGASVAAAPNTRDVAAMVDRAIGAQVVSATVAGGFFLDQAVMASNNVTSDDVVRAMDALRAPDGTPLFADAYPGFAVSFSRYC